MLKKIRPFKYYKPSTIEEALILLEQHKNKARLLAGGTDLLVAMKGKGLTPEYVINIKSFKDQNLNYINQDDNYFRIGALTKISDIEKSGLVLKKLPILAKAASVIGSVQIRNLATIGGNICNASPAADMIPALLVLEANVYLVGKQGKRKVAIKSLFTGPGKTVLNQEILTEIEIPKIIDNYKLQYINQGPRKAMDISQVVVATAIKFDYDKGTIDDARIAFGGVYSIPKRCTESENFLIGKKLNKINIDKVSELICEEISPICDIRGSDWYKLNIAKNLLIEELEKIGGGK